MPSTECDILLQLTPSQQATIEHLLSGLNDREAAEAVGVHRTTVTRWKLYHPAFRVELNVRRRCMLDVSNERLLSLVPKALDALEAELQDGKNRFAASLHILKSVGVLERPAVPEETDPEGELDRMIDERAESILDQRNETIPFNKRVFSTPSRKELDADREEAERQIREELSKRLSEHGSLADEI